MLKELFNAAKIHVIINDHRVLALGAQAGLPLLCTHVHGVQGLLEAKLALLKRHAKNLRLGGLGEAKALLAPVELHVELAHEDVSEDPQGAARGGDVDAGEAKDALGARLLEDNVRLGEGVVLAAKGEGEVGQFGRAVHDVLLAKDRLGTKLGGNLGHIVLWTSQEGGAGIHDGALHAGDGIPSKLHSIHVDLPVRLRAQGHEGEVTGVVLGVHATEQELTGLVVAEVEGEDWLGELAGCHQGLHGGGHMSNGDGIPSQAKDAIELAQAVTQTQS